MIVIQNTRFGDVEVNDDAAINFNDGLLGFPNERQFVLLEEGEGTTLGYLQSVTTSWLTLPVMDAAILSPSYPNTPPQFLARSADLADDNVAMLLVLARDEDESLKLLRVAMDATSDAIRGCCGS